MLSWGLRNKTQRNPSRRTDAGYAGTKRAVIEAIITIRITQAAGKTNTAETYVFGKLIAISVQSQNAPGGGFGADSPPKAIGKPFVKLR